MNVAFTAQRESSQASLHEAFRASGLTNPRGDFTSFVDALNLEGLLLKRSGPSGANYLVQGTPMSQGRGSWG